LAASRSAHTVASVKVDLYLDALERSGAGDPDLETLCLGLPWGDEIAVTLEDDAREGGDDVALVPHDPAAVPADDAHPARRAAAAYLAAARESPGPAPGRVDIELLERVPVGSGLGGAAADAAAALRLLAGLLPGRVGPERLDAVARDLGPDVPFLLRGGAAIRRGARLEAVVPGGPLDVVLILPPAGCDAAAVLDSFVRFRAAPRDGLRIAREALEAGDPERVRQAHHNALAFTVLKMHLPLRRFTADVERRLGRAPGMSGTGSALFDVPDAGTADEVLARLEGLPGQRVVVRV
jgi:4-diphosphocytidyl-2-C-methyl-D-erythritol kinase